MFDPDKHQGKVVEGMIDLAEAQATRGAATLGDVLDEFGRRSFQPLLILLGTVLVSPLSGIPVLSSIVGISIFLIAIQGALGRPHVWLPAPLLRRGMEGARLRAALRAVRWIARPFDHWTRRRFAWIAGDVPGRLLMGLCACGGLMLPFMELIPFSSSIMGGGIALVSLGLLVRDGVFALLGLTSMGIAATIPIGLATWVAGV